MWLRKASGGTSLRHRNRTYSWHEDGDVTEVPPELGTALLGIQDADYEAAEPPVKAVPAAKPVQAPAAEAPKAGPAPVKAAAQASQ
jgi:hypothetical protein